MSDDNDDKNIIGFDQKRKEILKKQKEELKAAKKSSDNPPMFNIPEGTKYFLGALIAIHIILTLFLPENIQEWIIYHLGFVPARFTDSNMVEPLQIITPFTHMFLHGSWLHIGMNGFMLLAFGAGLEKMIGTKKMIQIFFISGLFGVALHFALNLYSFDPVIGASGGLSGMFAAVLVLLNRQNSGMTGRYGIMPFIALWIGISVIFGMMGSPDGNAIAWAAHIGGFLGGFAALKILKI